MYFYSDLDLLSQPDFLGSYGKPPHLNGISLSDISRPLTPCANDEFYTSQSNNVTFKPSV